MPSFTFQSSFFIVLHILELHKDLSRADILYILCISETIEDEHIHAVPQISTPHPKITLSNVSTNPLISSSVL